MRILIVGAGPAGLALALALRQKGITPVVIERTQQSRGEGYAVGLHVNGWNAAERLGILAQMRQAAMPLGKAEYRNPRGKKLFSYDYRHLAHSAKGKMLAIMRDRVLDVLAQALGGDVDIRYGTTVTALADTPAGATVTFSDGKVQEFDVVVGADGYRSVMRELCFGPHEEFLRPLGYRAAAWRMPLTTPLASSFVGMMDVDLQGGVYAVGDGTAATLYCWRDSAIERVPPERRHAILVDRFGGWVDPVAASLAADIDWQRGFFDTIAQIEMPAWSKGRVVLLGDAAWCLTFLSGQGTSTALAGALILASELTIKPHAEAFAAYEARLRPVTTQMQAASRKIGGHYVPEGRMGMRIQSWLLPLLLSRPFAGILARRMMAKELELDTAG